MLSHRKCVQTGHGPADAVASFDNMLTTDQKGAVAELAIARGTLPSLASASGRAYTVERYDLIFDLCPRLVRVQCKWARRDGDVVVVRCYSNRRNRDGLSGRVLFGGSRSTRSPPTARTLIGVTSSR